MSELGVKVFTIYGIITIGILLIKCFINSAGNSREKRENAIWLTIALLPVWLMLVNL